MIRSRKLGIFPEPQKVAFKSSESRSVLPVSYTTKPAQAKAVSSWCAKNGLVYGAGDGAMELRLVRREDEETLYVAELNRLCEEKYRIEISTSPLSADIVYASERGLQYALSTLASLHRKGGYIDCSIEDYPSFALRGVIEGFYGPPWGDEQRAAVIRLLADYKMNTYVYGPKDDPYHRDRWADRYDAESLKRLKALIELTRDSGVTFCYSIGPGLSLRYSSDDDRRSLIAKLEQLYEVGVRSFALLLDDIPRFLQHPEDVERYPDLISAQIELVSRVYDGLLRLDSSIELAVCPTDYHGRGDEYTVSRLGRSIHPAIDIYWTGPEICSRELTLQDAARFAEATHHLPLYWDNYPVNDLEMSQEMHIGPYENRDRGLWRFSRGIISNGMQFAEVSKIPFVTIACFAWNPEAYDRDACNHEAIERVVGSDDGPLFELFAENLRESCLTSDTAPLLAQALERFRFQFGYEDRERALNELAERLQPLFEVSRRLGADLANRELQQELRPWLEKFRVGVEILRDTILAIQHSDSIGRAELLSRYEAYMANPVRVFSDVLYPALGSMLELIGPPQGG